MRKTILILGVALLVSGAAWAANTVTVTAGAALQGNFGMSVNFDGTTNNAFVEDQSPNAETVYHVTFTTNRATWVPTSGAQFYVLTARSGVPQNVIRFYVRENPNTPGAYHARAIARTDDLGWRQVGCGNFGLNDQTYDIVWKRSTGVDTNDGELTCLRNAAAPPSNSNTTIDNDTHTVDTVRFGYYQSFPANATAAGSYYLDDFISTRTAP